VVEQAEDLAARVLAEELLIPDHVVVDVPAGGRVVVVSDLHLPGVATSTSTAAADELAQLLEDWEEPGTFVIGGDGFELLAGPPDLEAVLAAHPLFATAVAAFAAGKGHDVVVLPGNHDGRLAWDQALVDIVRGSLGATQMALSCDLRLATGAGTEVVRVVHGNQADPYNTFEDPRSPVDTPFGHHIVREVLPELRARQSPGSILEGVDHLDGDLADFVGSRLFYRKVIGKLWLLAIPFVAALILRFVAFLPGFGQLLHHHAQRWLVGFGVLIGLITVVAGVAAVATLLRVNRALRETAVSNRADAASHNAAPRAEASQLVTEGYAGLVTGHTHQPELSVVGNGFYANSGSGTDSVVARPSRLRLPRPFITVRRCSYVTMRAAAVLEVTLSLRENPTSGTVMLERLAAARTGHELEATTVVASLPTGPTWPIDQHLLIRWVQRRRIRVAAAAILVLAGVLNLVLTLLWSVGATQGVDHWLPFGLHPLSGVAAVVGGIALCGLARGVRHGYRQAWLATIAVLLASTVDRLIQGRGLEGSAIACVIALWLIIEHEHFRVSPSGVSRYVGWTVTGGLVAVAIGAGIDELFQHGHREARNAVLLVVLGTIALVIVATLPGREHRRTGAARVAAFERAARVIETYGGDTLDYFALRDDKSWFFTGRSVVAYSVINRVMLVSPDPIGPPEDRAATWSDVMDLAQSNNWTPSVLAASQSWLPIYRAAGLVDHYVGDEAVVNCATFSLQGKSMKSLRGAYNRMKKGGYTVEVFDPATIDEDKKAVLLELMTETRQGEAERGYSMTLSRIFDPRDHGLLLAVCSDQAGKPVAFNQYIPASQVHGYSLDLMRRTNDPEAPNGLTDFVIIETINWMATQGMQGLGLNFATMRAVVADEAGEGPWISLEKTVLHHFSDTMQIESLWKFNKKYEPDWRPRYAVTPHYLRMARSTLAIARAESVTELPVVGRFLKPREPAAADET
jgi:lysylphosphatidylglycerol synthetase-like protein (DUF2156 family)/UDP-2,3-diacylglucosamine pyrophosphatase LpxH